MITANLPALQVLTPLLAAAVCSVIPIRRLVWFFACMATFATFACSVAILLYVREYGVISYHMGGWRPPFGIEYRIDLLNAFFLVLVSGVASFACVYAFDSVENEIEPAKQPFFYSAYLLCLAGLLGIVATNDAFNLYVFLEISSLATYALVAMGKDRRALVASFEYLILGTIGATLILIAVGLLYMMTGTLNISDMSMRVASMTDTMPVKAAVAFFTVGFALKIAIFPLHLWLTNAYTNAPNFISVFLSATATKVGIYVLIMVTYTLFDIEFSYRQLPLEEILVTLSVLAIIIGSFVAIMQNNIKRMLAYSSVAQIGYIVLGVSLATTLGFSAGILHALFHAIAKACLFMAAGCVALRLGGVRLEHFAGIGKVMPITTAVFIIGGLNLIGIPGTAGFISKWYLLQAAWHEGMWVLLATLLVSSLLAVIYVWKVVEVAYFGHVDTAKGNVKEAPPLMLLPMVLLAVISVIIGFYPAYITGYVEQVAVTLLGVGG